MSYGFIPTGVPYPDPADYLVPSAVPVDQFGRSLIPELVNRSPTHNESVLITGATITMASTNVGSIWWRWGHDEVYEPRLFVQFLDGSLYVYHGDDTGRANLSTAVGMIQTASPGRYCWNVLRVQFPVPAARGSGPGQYELLIKGTKRGKLRPQVVRLVP